MRLDSSVSAIVTGAASGLGAAVARVLRAEGVRVAIFDLNPQAGAALAAEIGAHFQPVDVTSDESVAEGLAQTRARHGQERVLVNCAGIAPAARTAGRDRSTGEAKPFPMPLFEKTIAVNLIGTFRMIAQSAAGMLSLPALDNGERGVIVNTASIAAMDGQIGQAAYAASKGGIVGMTLPIARDLAAEGIRINTILPGIFNTPLMQAAPEPVRAALAASVPFPPRLGEPPEFAGLVCEILRNSYLNGETIRLDGAIRMAPR